MRLFQFGVMLAMAVTPLGGCVTGFARTAVGPLKPVEVGVQQTVSCADLVRAIRAASDTVDQSLAVGGVSSGGTLEALQIKNIELLKTVAQTDAAYEACERKEASQRVTVDLEAARRLGVAGLVPGLTR